MTIELDCPGCDGRLCFASRRGGHGRLVGGCDTCGSVFTLYGGRVMPVDTTWRAPAPPWRFRALVERERRAACTADGAPAALAD